MKYGVTLTAKVSPELMELIKKVSEDRGESLSSFVRRAILVQLGELGYLSDEERKSLGLTKE